MKRASVTDAKNGLSALLDRVRQGESVLIEDRGIPVAQLGPVAASSGARDADVIARLERRGLIRPPAGTATGRRAMSRPVKPGRPVSLSRLVVDERGEGW